MSSDREQLICVWTQQQMPQRNGGGFLFLVSFLPYDNSDPVLPDLYWREAENKHIWQRNSHIFKGVAILFLSFSSLSSLSSSFSS